MKNYYEQLFKITAKLHQGLIDLSEEEFVTTADNSPAIKKMEEANKELARFIRQVRKDML